MHPADCVGFVFFVLGYRFIRDRKDGFLAPVILLGMLNKETTVVLILVYLFYRYDELSLKNLLPRLGGFLLLAAAGYFAVHQYYPSRPFYCAFYWYEQNFSDYRAYFYPLLIFSGFLFAAFHGWPEKGKFLRRSALMLPFFVVIHWTIAQIQEIRLFLPLFPIIIPLGMAYFFPTTIAEDKPAAANYLTRTKPLILYLSVWLLFAIFFAGYCRHNQKKYLTQQRYSSR